MNPLKSFCCLISLLTLVSCNSQTKTATWTGKLVYGYVNDINQYDFAGKKNKTVIKEAKQPFVTPNGEIYFVSDAFPKKNVLIKRSNNSFSQFRNVLDMSSENPLYKKQLDEYSVVNGTGISAVLDRMSDPRLSPDGKYLAVTIFGYYRQAFPNNCVAVFDAANGQLVTKFENKYYGNWLPDGRLLMSGSHKSGSADEKTIHSAAPGIYLSDTSLSTISRIDDGFDDPAPYHAIASPDGKKVAFVLNNHIWIMDIDGKNAKQLTDVDNDNSETYPVFSPDGKSIACWCYKTFERSFFTAIAIVPVNSTKPLVLSDKAVVWPKDAKGNRISGGSGQLGWVK